MITQIANRFTKNPKSLFLVDCLGALLSAFLLGIVLVQLETYFGIPQNTLYILAFLPCIFAAFDIAIYLFGKKSYGNLLNVVALLNILYCILSLGLAFNHLESITWLGWAYLILEIIIVGTLAMIEMKTAQKLKQ